LQNHYTTMQPIWDFSTKRLLMLQCKDRNSADFGVLVDIGKGYAEPASGVAYAYHFVVAYYNPASAYYRDENVLQAAIDAMTFMLANTNSDGTIDLKETNFHDSKL